MKTVREIAEKYKIAGTCPINSCEAIYYFHSVHLWRFLDECREHGYTAPDTLEVRPSLGDEIFEVIGPY
jgi:hypothetical protein